MSVTAPIKNWDEPYLKACQQQALNGDNAVVRDKRSAALQRFVDLGWPTRRTEAWKYTNVSAIAQTQFVPAPVYTGTLALALPVIENAIKLVFVNGHFNAELSVLDHVPSGVIITHVKQASQVHPELYQSALDRVSYQDSAFTALNMGLASDGMFLYVPTGVQLQCPVQLIFANTKTDAPQMSHPQHFIILAEDAALTCVEQVIGDENAVYFNNIVTQIHLSKRANLSYYKLQQESQTAFHVSNTQINQQEHSVFNAFHLALGAALHREDITPLLQYSHAQAKLSGLMVTRGKQHIDYHTNMQHLAPDTTSMQAFKTAGDDQSHLVFNGRILVGVNSCGTDARLRNNNLLLSNSAAIDTKPELEIYNDDVMCSHGATVGELDAEALFYLQARGISYQEAREILMRAFMMELIQAVDQELMRDYLQHWLDQYLFQPLAS